MHYILHMFIHYTYLNYIYLLPLCFTCKRDKNYLKKLSVEIFTYLNRGNDNRKMFKNYFYIYFEIWKPQHFCFFLYYKSLILCLKYIKIRNK